MDNNKIEADDADGFDMNVIKSFPKKNFPQDSQQAEGSDEQDRVLYKISTSTITKEPGDEHGLPKPGGEVPAFIPK